MNTSTLPLEAVDLDGDGRPWYPFRSPEEQAVLFLAEPVLVIPGAKWETCPAEFADRPHIPLDESHLAELLYFVKDPTSPYTPIDPDQVEPDGLLPLLTGVLIACRCDPQALDAWLVDEYAGGQYRTRLDRCRAAVHKAVAA